MREVTLAFTAEKERLQQEIKELMSKAGKLEQQILLINTEKQSLNLKILNLEQSNSSLQSSSISSNSMAMFKKQYLSSLFLSFAEIERLHTIIDSLELKINQFSSLQVITTYSS